MTLPSQYGQTSVKQEFRSITTVAEVYPYELMSFRECGNYVTLREPETVGVCVMNDTIRVEVKEE